MTWPDDWLKAGKRIDEPPKKEQTVYVFKKTWKFYSIGDLLRKLLRRIGK